MAVADTQEQIARAQLGIPRPLCYGPVIGAGNTIVQHSLADGTIVAFIAGGEGPWDGIDTLFINKAKVDHTDTTLVHFHPGLDGILGDGMTPISTGGDQRVDLFYNDLPTTVKKVTFSRTAYIALKVPPDPGAPDAGLEVLGFYRSMQCRQFDNTGTQTAFAYTKNYAWWALDLAIRFFVRSEALVNAALTANELNRFDFSSFYDSAQYFDEVLASGAKRFEGGIAVAQQTTWANLMEQVLRCCRSYMIEVNGKIRLSADKPRDPVFTLSAKHVLPGSWQPDKSNIRGSANELQGSFRDLNAKAATLIAGDGLVRLANVVTITLVDGDGDLTYYDGAVGDGIQVQNALDPSFDGEFAVASIPPGSHTITVAQDGPDANSGLGTISHVESKYAQRVVTLDHDQHQLAIGTRGVGLTPMRKRKNLQLDYGNNTWERTSRLVQFECYRYIGMDTTPYLAPWDVTVEAFWESIDKDGNLLPEVLPGDVIAVDETVSEEDQGNYEVTECEMPALQATDGGSTKDAALQVQLLLKRMVPDSFTDVPLPEDDTDLGSVGPGTGYGGRNYVIRSNPLTAHDAGASASIIIANFNIGLDTASPDPYYFGTTLINKVHATLYYIYVLDPFATGGSMAFQAVLALDPTLEDAGWLFVGSITTPAASAGDTTGNSDGGGGTAALVPKVSMPTVGVDDTGFGSSNFAKVYDGNPRSAAEVFAFGGRDSMFDPLNDAQATWSAFSAIAGLGGAATVNMKLMSDGTGTGVQLLYSLDAGATWTVIRSSWAGVSGNVLDTIPLTPSVVLADILIRGKAHQGLTSGTTCELDLYQAWIEAL